MFRSALLSLALALVLPAAARAEAGVQALAEALALPEVVEIMAAEGMVYGEELEAEMLQGQGGSDWDATLERIYAVDRVYPLLEARLAAELAGEDLAPMLRFFTSDLGRRVVGLEVSARRALLDPAVDEASRLRLDEMRAAGDPRLEGIAAFIEAGDLVELNVAGGLNSNLAFYRGLSQVGALPYEMTESEMLADVWGQEEAIRAETEDWLMSYLAMAYEPLGPGELEAYTEFSRSEAGQRLNRALFAGFDRMFSDVSHHLGQAVALRLVGQEL